MTQQDLSKLARTPSEAAQRAASSPKPPRYLVDSYMEWCREEEAPIVEDFGVNLLDLETGRWPRLGDGCKGAIVRLKGGGEHIGVFVLDIPPGGKSAPQRHIYDEVIVCLAGHGSVSVETADGGKHTFEFGPRSMFAPPLNARYQIFNGSGREAARLTVAHDLVFMMNFFRSEAFIFDNPIGFPERAGQAGYYSGEGELTAIRPGRNLWETNFVSDLANFELMPWEARGAGSSNMQFLLAEGSIGAHVSEMPVGTYKKAHRHAAGAHVFAMTGTGYSLLWYEGDKDFVRREWKYGFVYAPPQDMFHQHFNTSGEPARYMAILFGSKRYPIILERRANSEQQRTDTSVKEGGRQIEYRDQDPRIHAMWLKEMRANGVPSLMGKHIDESVFG